MISIEEFGKLNEYKPREKVRTEEERKEYRRNFREKHKKERKKYNEEHEEEISKQVKEYREEHKEECKANTKKWRIDNRKRVLFLAVFGGEGASIKLIQHIDKKGKLSNIGNFVSIHSAEENRLQGAKHRLGNATKLNEPFNGCEMHHIAEDVVIFLPKELHQSIRHNLKTGKNMSLMNRKALEWLEVVEGKEAKNESKAK